jgi:5'-nucleotidase
VQEGFILGVALDGVCAEPGRLDPTDPEAFRRAVLEERAFRDLEPVAGAAESLWRLSDAGVWIRLVTNRLHVNGGHQIAIVDTVEWLDRAHIPYRDLCFLGAKPRVEADCYVDDSPATIAALRTAGNEVIVFDRPHNDGARDPRARTWTEVEEIVMQRFTERQGVHGVQPQLPGVDGALGRRLGDDPSTR